MKNPDEITSSDTTTHRADPAGLAGPTPPRWGESRPIFQPGATVAGRYRILRFIAKGGMGEVYEAEDLELHERVALKTVRPDVAQNEGTIERFKREIHLARRVTHPNVCRIFDLGVDNTGPDAVVFLTMELLPGETLAARIKRAGRLEEVEAEPLVHQMVEALDAAHRAGIIHRDLKSANVLLIPGPTGLRAVITDFGLARSSLPDEANPSLTGSNLFVGTPAYLAPEQLEGKKVTAAADLYSLGVVLYEMFTSVRPHSSDTPMGLLSRRLLEPAEPPRKHVPTLPPHWEARILRCLERDPAKRYPDAAALLRELEAPAHAQPAARPRNSLFLGAAALLLGLTGLLVWLASSSDPQPTPHPTATNSAANPEPTVERALPLAQRRSIAVLGFKNLSGKPESQWLSTALAEMLSTELATNERLRVISQSNVTQMQADLAVGTLESYSAETLARIRARLGADLVVFGSYLALGSGQGGPIRLDLRLQDTMHSELVDSSAETGTEAELFVLVSKMGGRLRRALGLPALLPEEQQQVQAALPSQPEAARAYAEGLRKLRLSDAAGARELLEHAVITDPNQPLARAALAEALLELGQPEAARTEAEKAYQRASGLSREERFWVEGRYQETAGDTEKAIATYRTLFSYFSDNPDYGLRLAELQLQADQRLEAQTTLATLQKLPGASQRDPRIDLAAARLAERAGDFVKQSRVARQAAEKANGQGARLLEAEAWLSAWRAMLQLNDLAAARAAFDKARELFTQTGNQSVLRKALGNLSRQGQTFLPFPRDGALVPAADSVGVLFLQPIAAQGWTADSLKLQGAGPDQTCNTGDESVLEGTLEVFPEIQGVFLNLPRALSPGARYCAVLQVPPTGEPKTANPSSSEANSTPAEPLDPSSAKLPSEERTPASTATEDQTPASPSRWSFFVYDTQRFPGGALAFDADDFVEVPNAADLEPTSAFTFEAWVKLAAPIQPQTGLGGTWDDLTGRHRAWAIWMVDGTPELLMANAVNGYIRVLAKRSLKPGVWTHIAGTFDGKDARLYLDGQLENQVIFANLVAVQGQSLLLGRTRTGGDGPDSLRGMLDEVRLWNYARSAEQLKATMHTGVPSREQGLVAYWKFDEGGGETAADSTLQEHYGLLGAGNPQHRPTWLPSDLPTQP